MTVTSRHVALGILVAALSTAAWALPQQAASQQIAQTAAPTVDALFADAASKESAVRAVLATKAPAPTLLKAVRTVVSDYEALVRKFPTSGFCDDALWRAALLSSNAFDKFGEAREQAAAVRLFQMLATEYPTSKLARQVRTQIATLNAVAPKPAADPADSAPSETRASTLATITGIRRSTMPDVVRVVIELDQEVAFHDERLESPVRVFLDLPSTRTVPGLVDRTMRFDGDTDLVHQIRIGRHPNNTTRVVLEADGVSSYSVYPLYSPYRLVIDCLREQPSAPPRLTSSTPSNLMAPAPSIVTASAAPLPKPKPPLASHRVTAWPISVTLVNSTPHTLSDALVATEPALAGPVSPGTVGTPVPPPTVPVGLPARNLAGGFSMARQLGLGISRIVIDPGHGGHDPGAKGGGTDEAELVLDIALRVERLLTNIPGFEVVLTRRTDDYVPLQQRTAIANRENADLFLSIHANASNSAQIHGVETYFLNFATNLSAAAVAARENAASGQTMGELPDVVKTIALSNKLAESRDVASFVQRELVTKLRPSNKNLRDLGVKQAPFVVLIGAAMPSVLAEVSFMTNAQEAKLLKSDFYRQRIAEALAEGVRKYQSSLKSISTVAQQSR